MMSFLIKGVPTIWITTALLSVTLSITSCSKIDSKTPERTLRVSSGGRITTLDPALGADLVSSRMIASIYDTLLQYDYTKRPYTLIPSMLESMPSVSEDKLTYTFRLRDDLYFQKDKCFKSNTKNARKIESSDVIFSLLRLADARVHSPGFWLLRDKIKGINRFRQESSSYSAGNLENYNRKCEGFEIVDARTFKIHLTKPYPRLLYVLAMPYSSVVAKEAVLFYGERFAEHPVGSGPFSLVEWRRNYRIILERNPAYREEFFTLAKRKADRAKPLPLLDRVICYLVEQPLSNWLLFLQGELDLSTVTKDNFDAVVDDNINLIPALQKRGITLVRLPEFQINYIGFCFTDPLLGGNKNLRKAISLAYDVAKRVKHMNYNIIPAKGPIPPGVPGYSETFVNPYATYNIAKAKEYMLKAGFPNGINPKTGKPLEITFDLGKTSAKYRQLAEMMVEDMRKIGIKIKPVLNNKSRFFQKSREGKFQIYKISWIGDYPDAENFLQLFYTPNSGSCNRSFFSDKKFDAMYEEIETMQDSPERTKKYKAMVVYITQQCPWIFESHPVSFRLTHLWLENYIPHDFAFSRWKYLSLNMEARTKEINSFKPLEMQDLRR